MHEMVFHVFTQSGDEMESLLKEHLREGSRNRAAIPKQLAAQSFHQVRNRSPIIDSQMQFKTEEPAHALLATPGISSKEAVRTDLLEITDAASKSSQ